MTPYMMYRQNLKNGITQPAEKTKPEKIKQYSEKREKANKEYAKKSRPYWKGRECELKLPGCTGAAEGIQHMKGKSSIKLLLDENYWLASCNHCNGRCESHPTEAERAGVKLSRLKKE